MKCIRILRQHEIYYCIPCNACFAATKDITMISVSVCRNHTIQCFISESYKPFQENCNENLLCHNTEILINILLFKFWREYFISLYSIPAVNFCAKAIGGFGVLMIAISVQMLLFHACKWSIWRSGRKSFYELFKTWVVSPFFYRKAILYHTKG